jgi:hypothetical protein
MRTGSTLGDKSCGSSVRQVHQRFTVPPNRNEKQSYSTAASWCDHQSVDLITLLQPDLWSLISSSLSQRQFCVLPLMLRGLAPERLRLENRHSRRQLKIDH